MHVVYQIWYGETSEKQIRHKHKGYVCLSLATILKTHTTLLLKKMTKYTDFPLPSYCICIEIY